MTDRPDDKAADPPIPDTAEDYFAQEAAKLPREPDVVQTRPVGPVEVQTHPLGWIDEEVDRRVGRPYRYRDRYLHPIAHWKRLVAREREYDQLLNNRCPACNAELPRRRQTLRPDASVFACPACNASLRLSSPLWLFRYIIVVPALLLSAWFLFTSSQGDPERGIIALLFFVIVVSDLVTKDLERIVLVAPPAEERKP